MKLKKIASLALAGVMAVSMLAGCAGNKTDNTDKTEDTDLSAAVVAALNQDSEAKANYVATDDLTKAVDAVKAKLGTDDYLSKITVHNLAYVAGDVYTETNFAESKYEIDKAQSASDDQIKNAVEQATAEFTATYFWEVGKGVSDPDVAVKMIADTIKNYTYTGWVDATNAYDYSDNAGNLNSRVNFTYGDAKVSVYADMDQGMPVYFVTCTVTRTGNEVTKTTSESWE